MTALEIYNEYFKFVPSIYQQDLIESSVTDFERWRETLEFWAGSGYQPRNVLGMLRHYEKLPPGDWVHAVLKEHPTRDARLVEIAVIEVVLTRRYSNATKRIGSVNYFKPAVEQMTAKVFAVADLGLSSQMIDAVLERRREQFSGRCEGL
jgi:hypothetical protein